MDISDLELFIYFTFISFFTIIVLEFGKFFNYEYNEINLASSFALITITYLINSQLKKVFKNGYMSFDAKTIYLVFIFSFLLSLLFLSYNNENFLNLNYKNMCVLIDSRIEKIYNFNNVSYSSSCNSSILNLFFSFCLAITISSFYFTSVRTGHIDTIVMKTFEKLNYRTGIVIKIKQILNIFILICLINPLFKNYLLDYGQVNDMLFYQILLPILVILELILSLVSLKYQSYVYLEQNYLELMEYNPQSSNYQLLKTKIIYINDKFWILISEFIYFSYLPLLLYLFFINRSGSTVFLNKYVFGEHVATLAKSNNNGNLNLTLNNTSNAYKAYDNYDIYDIESLKLNRTYTIPNKGKSFFNATTFSVFNNTVNFNDTIGFTNTTNANIANNLTDMSSNSTNSTSTLNIDDFVFKTHFMETTVYFFFFAVIINKTIITLIYQFVQRARQDSQRLIL